MKTYPSSRKPFNKYQGADLKKDAKAYEEMLDAKDDEPLLPEFCPKCREEIHAWEISHHCKIA